MYKFCPLASGSSGNSLFLSSKAKILIDVGISFRDLVERLKKIDVKIDEIDAVLITHEHKDHIEGIKKLSQNTNIPIFSNFETAKGIYRYIGDVAKFKIFTTDENFEFKDLIIKPFSIPHDAMEPVGFNITIVKENKEIKLGICTDLGFVTSYVKKNLENCDYLYIESNHDVNMLLASRRPNQLKKRILGRRGHISNEECKNFIKEILHPNLKHIFLSHISGQCNCKKKALDIIKNFLEEKNHSAVVSIAYREKVSDFVLLE